MKQTTLRYKIDQDGNVEESVQGIEGTDCEAVTKPIEEALGNVVAQTHTTDYFTSEENWRAGYDVMTEGALGDYPDD